MLHACVCVSVCDREWVALFKYFINAGGAAASASAQPSIYFLITKKKWNCIGRQKQSIILIYWRICLDQASD